MITLYGGPLSLFSRKVEIALGEKGLAYEQIMVPFNQTDGYRPVHPEVAALNPKGQVPVLNDDGLVLYDSTIIVEYLDEAYPDPPLYPRTAAERARCRLNELYADEIMFAGLRPLMHRTGPPACDPTTRAARRADALIAEDVLAGLYGELELRLAGQGFFAPQLSAADIALFVALHWGVRLGAPSFAGHFGLSDWYRRLRARPAFARVVDAIAEADRRLSFSPEGRPPIAG